MYAKPLGWEIDDGTTTKELPMPEAASTELLTVPMHKMYAKVELVEKNYVEQLLVLDRTGNGSILSYNVTQSDEGLPVICHMSCEEEVCDILKGVKDFAVAQIDNKVYISGGFDINDDTPLNALVVFDGNTGGWRLLSGMKKARCNHTMVKWKNGFLVAGGRVDNNFSKLTPMCELYDVEVDRWTAFDWLPEVRCCHACVVHKDNVYISGGLDSAKQPQSTLWVYERTTSKWATLDEDHPVVLPYSVAKHKMVSNFDSIYIIGGVSKDSKGGIRATPRIVSFKPEISYLGYGALSQNLDRTKYDRVTPWSHDHKLLSEPLYNTGVITAGNTIMAVGGSVSRGRNNYLMTFDIEKNTMHAQRMTTPKNIRGLPLDCDSVITRTTRKKALHQFVPRNWPLW